jgi:pimeloyl-ACP methyl ester carboxylesterase
MMRRIAFLLVVFITVAGVAASTASAQDTSIRAFHINIPEEQLVDLRRRIAATRWPERETVDDASQGVQLATLQALVRYWGTDYDWRKAEARLNAFPQFVTTIDGVDIHFIHVRSRHPHALPLIMTHGWPRSIIELLKTVGPLTDPTAYGGRAGDAFDLVLPSIPGFGFSGKPRGTGWAPDRIARVWAALMQRLGYTRYVAQGGDWGAPISSAMARQAPAGLLGIHLNYPASVPLEIDRAIRNGDPAPAGLSAAENAAFDALKNFSAKGAGYRVIMGTRPQTLGVWSGGLARRLCGLHVRLQRWRAPALTHQGRGSRQHHAVLANEHRSLFRPNLLGERQQEQYERCGAEDSGDLAPRCGDRVSRRDLPCAEELDPARLSQPRLFQQGRQGRAFAAWEQPQLFSEELRAAFRSLRGSP